MTARRLLLSARDPGAARSIVSLAKIMERDDRFQIMPVGQGSAIEVWRAAGFAPRIVDLPALDGPGSPGREVLFQRVVELLDQLDPDAIITGLSGPGLGVDEALVHLCRDRPVFSLQDYEGWVVGGFGEPAATYLVPNEYAARLTARAPTVEPVVVGDVRYSGFATLDIPAIRATWRAAMGLRGPVITFYGQPAWGYAGYPETLRALARAARDASDLTFLYRAHPKETVTERANLHALFDSEGASLGLCSAPTIEASLASTDTALSVFSTVGQDHVNLQRYSREPIGVAAYLLLEPAIRNLLAADTGGDLPVAAASGLAEWAGQGQDLAEFLRHCSTAAAGKASWLRVRQALPPSEAVGPTVAEHLLERIHQRQSPDDRR